MSCHIVLDVKPSDFFTPTRQNRHEMTRAGVVQKAPDMFLRGAFVIFFDTRLPEGCLLDTPKGCRMDTHAKGCLLGTRLYILVYIHI